MRVYVLVHIIDRGETVVYEYVDVSSRKGHGLRWRERERERDSICGKEREIACAMQSHSVSVVER